MAGKFVWHDLMTTDADSSIAFYGALFGWTAAPMEPGGDSSYQVFSNNHSQFGGVIDAGLPEGMPPYWVSHLSGPNSVDVRCEKTVAAGGSVMQPPFDIPGIGRVAFVNDPQGAGISLFEGIGDTVDEPATEYGSVPGGVSWIELLTNDPAAATALYSDLTGWTSQVMDMGTGTYTIMQDGETMVAGIADLPPGESQSGWVIYFEIIQETMEAALEEVKRLGGLVAMGPMVIPTGGTIAAIADPNGAMLALIKSAG